MINKTVFALDILYFLLLKNYSVEPSEKSHVFVSFFLILLGIAQNLTNTPGSVLSDKTTRTHETNTPLAMIASGRMAAARSR